jgi:hypothetical protein
MATFPSKVNYTTGEVLTAAEMNDIGGAINLLDSAQYAAGKNKIINGDFGINQRAFTSTTSSGVFGFDRFSFLHVGGTNTYSAQTFTLGAAPVAGYEGTNFARLTTSGQSAASDLAFLDNKIESVRTLAGQTVTVSLWAKTTSGTPKFAIELGQNFGTGGSPSSEVNTYLGQGTTSSSWQRFTFTVALPSISGKTIGTNGNDRLAFRVWTSAGSDFNARTGSLGLQAATIDVWGVQVEAASTASNFQTATGTKQGELAACQRYYYRSTSGNAFGSFGVSAVGSSATIIRGVLPTPVTLRVSPTSIDFSTLCYLTNFGGSVTAITNATIYATCVSLAAPVIEFTTTGGATNTYYQVIANNSATAFIGLSAEL